MNPSIRKIIYYENILEFKESTQSQLELKDVNNWQLCRFCLTETKDDDMVLEKMCVMDVMEGRFLSAHEMLTKVTTLSIHKDDKLPFKMCRDCIEKLTNMYLFSVQIEKAQDVLEKLSRKLRVQNRNLLEESENKIENSNGELFNRIGTSDEICTSTTSKCGENVNSFESDDKSNIEELDSFSESSLNDTQGTTQIDESHCETMDENNAKDEEFSNENQDYVIDTNMEDNDEDHLEEEKDVPDDDVAKMEIKTIVENLESTCATEDNDTDSLDGIVEEVYVIEDQNLVMESKINGNSNITANEDIEDEYIIVKATRETSTSRVKESSSNQNKRKFKHKQSRVSKPLLENTRCGICQKIFDRQRDLVSHVKQEHPNSKAYQCRVCLNFFSHTQSLSRHMNTHKPIVNKNTCEYCTKAFMRPEDLRRHIRIHTGERPYSCPLCEKAFKQQSEMREHITIHFENNKYKCDQCERVFASRNSLYLHKKKHSQQ